MPTLTIDARVRREDDGLLWLELEYEGRTVEMTAYAGTPLEELALMALQQPFPPKPPIEMQRRYVVEAHRETVELPEDGTAKVWVVDSVTPESLPGWGPLTPDEVAAWIDTNVVDLASAKVALKALCYRR